jgi:hypothetical protein
MARTTDFVDKVRRASGNGSVGTDSSVWQGLMRQGVIAQLHIGRPRFEQRLELADLGIAPRGDKERKAIAAQVRPGVKMLLPPEYFRAFGSIESAARHTLTRRTKVAGQGRIYAFETPFGTFVPVTSFDDWLAKVREHQRRYFAKRDELLKHYDEVRKDVLKEYTRVAHGAYDRLPREEQSKQTRLAFIRRYVATIRDGFPTNADIRTRFIFTWQLNLITLPDDLRRRIVAEEIATAEEKKRIRELNEMRIAVGKSTMAAADEFTKAVDQQLYSLVYEVAAQARASLKKSTSMPSKTLVQLENLVKQVKALNFVGHKDLLKWAENIDGVVNGYRAAKERYKPDAYSSLMGTLDTTFMEAQRRLSDVGVAVRHSRMRMDDDNGFDDYAEVRVRQSRGAAREDGEFGEEGERRRTRRNVI